MLLKIYFYRVLHDFFELRGKALECRLVLRFHGHADHRRGVGCANEHPRVAEIYAQAVHGAYVITGELSLQFLNDTEFLAVSAVKIHAARRVAMHGLDYFGKRRAAARKRNGSVEAYCQGIVKRQERRDDVVAGALGAKARFPFIGVLYEERMAHGLAMYFAMERRCDVVHG